MDENKFWLVVNILAVTLVLSVITSVNFWQAQTDRKIIEMVKAGASPESAYCALRGSQEQVCSARRANGR